MTTNGVYARLSAQIAESRARLDAIEEGINRLLGMANLPLIERPPTPEPTALPTVGPAVERASAT